jgi:multiple sugar transport system ATP-binding protein
VVYVTHDQIEAMTLATRIAVMKDGAVQQFADPQTIYEQPENIFVADFIGAPPMNFIPALVVSGGSGPELLLRGDEREIRLPLNHRGSSAELFDQKSVVLGIRPEHITKTEDGPNAADRTVVEGRVDVIEPTGAETLVVFKFGGVDVTAKARPKDLVYKGALNKFAIDMSAIHLFDQETGRRL